MQFALGNNETHVFLTTGSVRMSFQNNAVRVDDFVIDFPGEYERSLIFFEVRQGSEGLIYILTVEGKTLIYLPEGIATEDLAELRDVNNKDIIVFPAKESLWKVLETWEASVAVPYGSEVVSFLSKLGQTPEIANTITLKAPDFESETTRFLSLG